MNDKKAIPVGTEFYKEIIDNDLYYVDKTLFIRDLLKQKNKVSLFTRPRRFGKTLMQSMIQTFFEQQTDKNGNIADNSKYFTGKKITAESEIYTSHMGKYPVIFLSLKSAKQPTYELAYYQLQTEIISEFERHAYVLGDDALTDMQKRRYQAIMDRTAEDGEYITALKFLAECLEKHHEKKTIILIDEYDVPLENAYFAGFYNKMVSFISSFFESALKTNEYLQLSVVTGCLRISKESIFTGLNNLEINSVLNENYAGYFGFTQSEVDEMLKYYGIEEHCDEVKAWYDGYLFGSTEVYNPWSVINYVKDMSYHNTDFPKPYWSNTSSNNIVREMIENADSDMREEIEILMSGDVIEKPIHEDITYDSIRESQDNLWNFLFFTGYLKAVEKKLKKRTMYITLKVPNEEILYIYENTIQEWFEKKIKTEDFTEFYADILNENAKETEDFLINQLCDTISMHDSTENFYHGFLLGLLANLTGYKKMSNRESGIGRFDIVIKQNGRHDKAVIFELKRCKEDEYRQMERYCKEALRQIDEKQYDSELIKEGYAKIIKYGICFCGKSCKVLVE